MFLLFSCLFFYLTYLNIGEIMKIDFIDDDNLIVYYISDESFDNEKYIQLFIKMLDKKLRKQYDYDFRGYYNVDIYRSGNTNILEFERESDYGKAYFDITVYLNSTIMSSMESNTLSTLSSSLKYSSYLDRIFSEKSLLVSIYLHSVLNS